MKSLGRKLALVALASLAIYVLACRSSFSPDGSKILVTAAGGAYEQGHLLMYDRKAAKWTPLLSVGKSHGGDSVPIPTALWSADGKEVIATWALDQHKAMVSVLPVGGTGPTRFLEVIAGGEESEDVPIITIVPPVLRDHYLLFGGESLTVLDLKSGAVDRQELPGNDTTNSAKKAIWLVDQGKEVGYLMGSGETVEAGRLDLADLAHLRPVPRFQLNVPKKDGNPFLAVSESGTRLALTSGDDDNQSLLIYRQSQLERSFPFGAATNQGIVLGNLVWSPDGKTLYAAGFKSLQPGPLANALHAGYQALRAVGFNPTEPRPLDFQMFVCEIPLDGRPIRETPLFRMASAHNEGFRVCYQIALSPDGKTIAAADGFAENHRESRRPNLALYLLDLSGSRRSVSRIPIPRALADSVGLLPE